jgi:hypothetical protein
LSPFISYEENAIFIFIVNGFEKQTYTDELLGSLNRM